jgi:transcriptional regulator of heat shock response
VGAQALSDRDGAILRSIVEGYVTTARPVSSGVIAAAGAIDLSSATVRNVMRALEIRGFISQPHTSAGRVPTDRGYRYYVDHLMSLLPLTTPEQGRVRECVEALSGRDLAAVASGVSKAVSELTRELAVTVAPAPGGAIEHVRYEGARYMLRHPEFHDHLSALARVMDSEDALASVVRIASTPGAVTVTIGHENRGRGLERMSIVVGSYRVGRAVGRVGVIGPTRMRYPRLVGLVRHFSEVLDKAFAQAGGDGGREGAA